MAADRPGGDRAVEQRGLGIVDVDQALEALADFAEQNADAIEEIDLNPIKALPQGRGCVVVDALIVAKGATRG